MDEAILGILRGAGFGDADAVGAYHAFIDLDTLPDRTEAQLVAARKRAATA
ncbi:hypothetical protein [Streptomyces sp. TLI_105]|uniref:hypothetical protein n=1 Tax=Streptomyces sp. TLI_105 TaxID=1881019 RepID=UPI0008989075|nr:hypothetical protein [Streptomyces sp. TLI_105]SEE16222.1 hypothetical protein SAMN05428939_7556 [Streptomyces sp. TLI_105]